MATNTFYATSCTNSTYNGLLNGGEDSWSRSSSTSWKELDLGYFTYNMSSIRNTIPSVATISNVEFSIDIKQSRSSSIYQTSMSNQLFVGSTAKSNVYTSGNMSNSYQQSICNNSVAITSEELHSQDLKVHYIARYKGTLGVTQYAKNLYCRIVWSPINTTSISLNKTSTTLNKGTTETLTVSRSPSSVSYPTISWTSSNTSVATVNSSGVVTAVGNGTATITAATTDGTNLSKTCTVTVRTPVSGVTVSPATLSLNVSGTYTLAKTISPSGASNQNVTWSTDDIAVATVDSNGKVTAVGKGICTITCTSSENSSYKGTCTVTVNQQATGISICPTTKELSLGSNKPNLFDYNKWYSNSFTAIDAYLSKNEYGLTLTSIGDDSYTNTYHMQSSPSTSDISTVDNLGFAVTAEKKYTFAVDVFQNAVNSSQIFVFWYNSNKAYMTHKDSTIVGSGTLTLTEEAPSGAEYACIRFDNNNPGYTNLYTNIRVQEEDTDIVTVGQCNVYAKVLPHNVSNENYTLISNNTNIATVTNNGLITAVSPGTCTITATSEDGGHTATCTITVVSADVNIFKIANGNVIIKNMLLGTTSVKKAYIGATQIFGEG